MTAATVEQAYSILEKENIDLALLDRVLDDGDGIEIVSYLNDISFHTRTILLSQLGETEQRILGLSKGADDYLPKPFSLTELSLKVEKLLSKEKINTSGNLRAGELVLQTATGEALVNNKPVQLRRRENQILSYLVKRKNQTVSREQMIDAIWGTSLEIPTYSTIDAYIRKIRVKLGPASCQLKTVRGFGYRVID